jgi:alpha-N-arabinofuranosidase
VIEDTYNVADAVVVGNLLISLLRHSDRVTTACQAQLVNVIAPIRSEPGGPAWRQTTFHPFAQAAGLAHGEVLRVEPVGPTYETDRYGEVPLVDAVATRDPEAGETVVFAVNRHQSEDVALTVDLRAMPEVRRAAGTVLTDADLYAINTAEQPDRVTPVANDTITLDDATLRVTLPPVSWNVVQLGT